MIDSISSSDLPENSRPVKSTVPPMLMTVAEVAARLQVSPSSVYLLIERGLLSHHRIGARRGAIRITEENLAHYLESCREETKGKSTTPVMSDKPPMNLKHLRL